MTRPDYVRAHRGASSSASRWEEIEGPLEAVVGLADILRDRSRDVSAAARNEMIDQLATHAWAAQHILDNLILAAKLEEGRIELESDTVDLRDLVEIVAQEWTLDRGIRVTVTGSVDAVGDRDRIARVVLNLFEDAFARSSRILDVRIAESYSKVIVEIDDDGDDIPAADVDALAMPHHRRQAAEWDGAVLGLGVAVARGLAKGMGGDVRYFRTDGVNTCELTLRKQSVTTSRRRQLLNFTVDPMEAQPTSGDIHHLVANESISMVYQPIVDMRTGDTTSATTVGYESLARFPYSTPPEWFKLAGAAGVGVELELHALAAGIAGFTPRDQGSFLALNISNATLLAPRLTQAIESDHVGRIVLELSDTARIRSYEATRRTVDSLRERGIRLAVDDVGAGEIDMWHILRLDPEIIKLDRHLVADQDNVRRNNALIKGIATMATHLGIMVIAEAVETENERLRLLELGVEFGQGYLFGRPEPLEWKTRVLSDKLD